MARYVLFFILLFSSLRALAQFPGGIDGSLHDSIFSDDVHGVRFSLSDWEFSPPILQKGSLLTLRLSFDVLSPSAPRLSYRIVHCDSRWRESQLAPFEYQEGFPVNSLEMPSLSVNTLMPFAHYTLTLPNRDVRFKLSGNYVVQIVDAYDESRILLQRQFAVCEDLVSVEVNVERVAGAERLTHQRVESWVDVRALGTMVSPRDLVVYAKQNWYDPCYVELQQTQFRGASRWLFGGVGQGVCPAGNEWRMVDLQSLHVPGTHVRSIERSQDGYDVEVELDSRFGTLRHVSRSDFNGYCAVGFASDSPHSSLESLPGGENPLGSDYLSVYFTLAADYTLIERGVWLQLSAATRGITPIPMRYNVHRGQFEGRVFLKQGVYSYRYVTDAQSPLSCADVCAVEGCFAESENEYYVLVYYRGLGDRSDRLVGYARLGGRR